VEEVKKNEKDRKRKNAMEMAERRALKQKILGKF